MFHLYLWYTLAVLIHGHLRSELNRDSVKPRSLTSTVSLDVFSDSLEALPLPKKEIEKEEGDQKSQKNETQQASNQTSSGLNGTATTNASQVIWDFGSSNVSSTNASGCPGFPERALKDLRAKQPHVLLHHFVLCLSAVSTIFYLLWLRYIILCPFV